MAAGKLFLFAVALFVSSARASELSDCLLRSIQSRSPDTAAVRLNVERPLPVVELSSADRAPLKAEYVAKIRNAGELPFSVRSFDNFFGPDFARIREHGIFVLFIPSGLDAPMKVGHAMVLAGDALFDRNLDNQGPLALRSTPLSEVPALARHFPYAVAQYFELTPAAVHSVNRFFHDRTWGYHAGDPAYRSKYVNRPLSVDASAEKGENCSTFVFSFLCDAWSGKHPELAEVRRQFGSILLNQVPSRQLYNNTQANSFRGTLFLSVDPRGFAESLQKDGLRSDPLGSQLLLEAPAKPLDRTE